MAKPKKWDTMTPEQQAAWRERKREEHRKWSKANPEKRRESENRRRKANPEKRRESDRKRYQANPQKQRERVRKYREANPEKRRESDRKLYYKCLQQAAADSFFQLQAAAQEISTALQTKTKTNQ